MRTATVTMRAFPRWVRGLAALACALAGALATATPAVAQSSQPNVVLIIVDDLNDWVGVLNEHPQTQTPRMDALAAEGTLFTNAHAAAPLCHPSRVSFMTGMSPGRTGMKDNQSQPWRDFLPDAVSLNQAFRNAGYYTIGLSKIYHGGTHNQDPTNWDSYTSRPPSAEPPAEDVPINGFDGITRGGPGGGDWGVVNAPASEFEDHIVATWAEEFLDNRSPNNPQPFFLAVGLRATHSPWYFPQSYFDRIAGGNTGNIVLPQTMSGDLDDVGPVARQWAAASIWNPLVSDPAEVRWAVHSYLAAAAFADDQVGRVLDALQGNGFADNTIVVLVSDHGYHLSEKQTWQKQQLWEEDTRVPMMFRVPQGLLGAQAAVVNEPVSISALFPTLLELAGIDAPAYEHGDPDYRVDYRSLVPLLDTTVAANWDGPAVTYGRGDDATLRFADTRFTLYRDAFTEFYDRLTDPNEWFNVSGSAPYAGLVPVLASDASRYLNGTHAPFGYRETCGPVSFNPVTEPGVHLWRDCGDTSKRAWRLRTSAATGGTQVFIGDVDSSAAFSDVSGVNLEPADTLDNSVHFAFSTTAGDTDGANFAFPLNASACLSFSALPAGSNIYVGETRFPASVPLNLATLETCGPDLPTGEIGDYVWHDSDGDGFQDANEAGHAGVEVRLVNCQNDWEIATETTDSTGRFLFAHVAPGNYRLRFIAPAGYGFTQLTAPVGGGYDSNADPATGLTNCLPQAEGQSRIGIDAGLVMTGGGPLPSLSVGDAVADEDSGNLVFTVSLSGGTSTTPVTFTATTTDGTAQVADNDYTPLNGVAGSIPAGQVSTTVSVALTADSAVEPDETLTLTLGNISSNVTVADNSGLGTIANDDSGGGLPLLSIDDPVADEDSGTLVFNISLSGGTSASDVTFIASTADGTATFADNDYTPLPGTAGSIPAGETSTTVAVALVADSAVEPDETLTLQLSSISANVNPVDTVGLGTIRNDDSAGGGVFPITAFSAPTGGVSVNGNVISYSGPPNGWFQNTVNSLPFSTLGLSDDYEIRFTLLSNPAGSTWVVGLGIDETTADWRDVEFGLRSSNGQLTIYESGNWRTGAANMSAGDVIAIAVNNGSIEYRLNGVTVYTSAYNGTPDFYIDSSFKDGTVSMSVEAEGATDPVEPPSETLITEWSNITGGVSLNGSDMSYSGSPPGWNTNTANSARMSSYGATNNYSVSWTVDSVAQGTTWIVGFGIEETNAEDWRDVDFGIRSSQGELNIRNNGNWITNGGQLAVGDVLSLHVGGGVIEYRRNGFPVATSAIAGTEDFYIDTAFKNGAIALGSFTLTLDD